MMELDFTQDRLMEITKEIGMSSSNAFFERVQNYLQDISSQSKISIDLITSEVSTFEIRSAIENLQKNNAFKWSHWSGQKLRARKMNEVISAFALIFIENDSQANIDGKLIASILKDQCKFVWIINNSCDETLVEQLKADLGLKFECKCFLMSDFVAKDIEILIRENISSEKLRVIKKYEALNSTRPILHLLEYFFLTENRIVQARKLVGMQNQQLSRKDEQSANQMDLMNQVRTMIQKFSGETDRNIKSKYEELNKPKTGDFSKLIHNLASGVNGFDRKEIAEKSEKEEIKLKDDFSYTFIFSVREFLSASFKKDIDFTKASVDELVNRINMTLSLKGVDPINVATEFPPYPDQKNSTQPYLEFNREFKGELMKRGIMEYFVALRDYTGVIMVATGLLAPLTIIANISESGFLKHLSNAVKLGMAGITIFLIFYGIYDLRKRIPKKRVEEYEREISKAKELLLSEGKRMVSESARDWSGSISNWIRDASLLITNAVEKNLKDAQMRKQAQLNKDKIQLQKQQQNLEQQNRNLQVAEKMKDGLVSKWREWSMEFDKVLRS